MNGGITKYRGSTIRLEVTILQSVNPDVPLDLTGVELFNASTVPPYHVMPNPELLITDVAAGKALIHWTDEQTRDMAATEHPFRLGLIYPNGDRDVPVEFKLYLL